MKTPVLYLVMIAGIGVFIVGAALALATPPTITGEPKRQILANEEALTVSGKSQIETKTADFTDIEIPSNQYRTYEWAFDFMWINTQGEAGDFMLIGNASEQSSPQVEFDFYVFDERNFDRWKIGETYTAFYEAKGKTSLNFSFPITMGGGFKGILTSPTIYFVVERSVFDEPVVHVTSMISWAERIFRARSDYSNHFISSETLATDNSKDFVVKGNVSEIANKSFNFYIFDLINYGNWIEGTTFTSYFGKENITSTSFSVPLAREQATSPIYFAAENIMDDNETVKVSATLEWNEAVTGTTMLILLGGVVAFLGLSIAIIAGLAAVFFKPKAPTSIPKNRAARAA